MPDPVPPALPSAALPSDVPTFTPVRVKTRAGWTAGKQGVFIETLTATGSVRVSTDACGMTQCSVYKLRHRPGAESFARAWDEAVTLAARRVRDVLIEQAIHGVPERVLIGRDTVVERRRFNHRTMIWVLQHHMPDLYPSGSTTHRRGWRHGRETEASAPPLSADALRAVIGRKLDEARRPMMRALAADPVKREAYETLNGPQDWAPITDAADGGCSEEAGARAPDPDRG